LKFEKCLDLNMLTFDLKQSRTSHGLATSNNNNNKFLYENLTFK